MGFVKDKYFFRADRVDKSLTAANAEANDPDGIKEKAAFKLLFGTSTVIT